jgi:hypothetical protein
MLTSLARGATLMLAWQTARPATQGVWAIGLARLINSSDLMKPLLQKG